jgi:AcrR family transcriptional regulator
VPRAGLNEARVTDEAAQMADEIGLSRLTLAALADRRGVRYPSLYKHVDGMDGLQRGIAIRAKNELAAILARATVGRARGDAMGDPGSHIRASRQHRPELRPPGPGPRHRAGQLGRPTRQNRPRQLT